MANEHIISLHDCQKIILSSYATPIHYAWTLMGIPIGAILPVVLWTWCIKVPILCISTIAILVVVPILNIFLYFQHMVFTLSFPSSVYVYSAFSICKNTYVYLVLHIDSLVQREHVFTTMVLGSTLCFSILYTYIDYRNRQIFIQGNAAIQETIDHNVRLFTKTRSLSRSLSRNRLRFR